MRGLTTGKLKNYIFVYIDEGWEGDSGSVGRERSRESIGAVLQGIMVDE